MKSQHHSEQFQNIAMDKLTSTKFQVRYYRDDRPLHTSLQTYGIFHPPVVIETEKGDYSILDGTARVDWCRHANLSHLICQVIHHSEFDDKQLFLKFLEMNRWNREFNLVEKGTCVKLAHDLFGGLSIPKVFWSTVGVKDNIKSIHQHKEVLKLPEVVLKFAVTNSISVPVILSFLRFPKNDIEQIARYLLVLPINQNKLAEILGHLWDISRREEISPLRILDDFVAQIDMSLSQVQKEQKLRQMLQLRRNPNFEVAMRDFHEKVSRLRLDDNTKVSPPPFFEDEYVDVHSKIRTLEDLNQLKQSLQDENWTHLLKEK